MNFIYDIVLNFNKSYYDFFEWNKKDSIINIKKIPLFLVDNDTFFSIKYNKVTVSNNFINNIKDKKIYIFTLYNYFAKEIIIADNELEKEIKDVHCVEAS